MGVSVRNPDHQKPCLSSTTTLNLVELSLSSLAAVYPVQLVRAVSGTQAGGRSLLSSCKEQYP